MIIEERAQGFDQRGALAEILAHIRVDSQIGIALARAQFRSLKPA